LHPGAKGHDVLTVVIGSGFRRWQDVVFGDCPICNLRTKCTLRMYVGGERGHDLIATVHKLDQPRTDIRGYRFVEKKIAPHPDLGPT
jgi:hypothetical protein